jgi:Zn-dependent protease/CBS domain-containing protein
MMFGKRIPLLKIFGFQVWIDASWLILGLLITWSLADGLFPQHYKGLSSASYWLMGAGGAIGLLFSIVFHEMWHSLIARKFGLPMKGITLFIFGGVAEMTDEPRSPRAEFSMAVAGPLSSVILGLAFLGMRFVAEGSRWPAAVAGVLGYLGFMNLILAAFNLLPAFPLDGGRVLRSILWGMKDNIRWATRIASQIGSGFAALLMVIGVLDVIFGNIVGGIWFFLIGMFLRSASQTSYQQLLIRKALEGEPVRKFMVPDPVTVSPSLRLKALVEDYIYKYHYKLYPVVDGGQLVGCITLNQVKEVPKEEWDRYEVSEMAKSCSEITTIGPDEDAMKALSIMNRTNASRLMVVEGTKLVGVIALKDILKLLSLKIDLEKT